MLRLRMFLTMCITVVAGLAASSANAQNGACCLQSGACSSITSTACASSIGTWLGSGIACPTTGVCYGEREPNSNGKLTAANNAPPPLNSGDSLAGIANGAANDATYSISGSTAANNAVDFWILTTAAKPLGIYRHEVQQVRGTGTATTLRGNAQVTGVSQFTNTGLQSPSSSKLAWYGFGKQEQIIFEPASTGTSAYLFTLTDTTIAPTVASGTLYSGAVTMRVINSGANVIDSDTWLYDSNFNALPNDNYGPGGADGQIATANLPDPANTKTSFTRILTPGTYYLAVAPFNLANNLPSVQGAGESSRASNTICDFPNALVCSAMNTLAYTASVQLADAAGNTVNSPNITWASASNGFINFVQFTVGSDPTTGECCVASACSVTTHDGCTGAWTTGGTCAPGPCATPTGNCCTTAAYCSISTQANCPSGLWTAGGSCAPNPCTAQCCSAAGACTLSTQTACTGYWNLSNAACGTNPCPQPTAACCDILNNTCIIVYTGVSCGAGTAAVATTGATCTPSPCPAAVIGTCCSNSSGTCTLLFTGTCNATSFTSSASLTCNPSPCPATGTCCDAAGICTQIFGGSCASTLTPGVGNSCTPSPCSVLHICCDNITGVCSLYYSSSACGTGTTQIGTGTVCSPDPCAPAITGTCCNTTSGACNVVYTGGSCGSGTASNASLTCSPTPCAPLGICCTATGVCTVNYGAACSGSLNTMVFVCGSGSGLPNTACPPLGICCLFASGSCTVTYSGTCNSNAAFHTDTTCGTPSQTPGVSCIPYAAATCCSTTGSCSVIYGGSCAGRQTAATTCSPNPCTPIGTCCNTTTGVCTLLYSGSCIGTSAGSNTTCNASSCAAFGGACCTGTACSFVDEASCGASGGSWTSGVACVPNACVGSCCDNTTYLCSLTTDAASCGTGNTFAGLGTTCTTNPCPPPANDTCAGAIGIMLGSSTPGNNVAATNDTDPLGAGVQCNTLTVYTKGVWFTYTEGSTPHRLSANVCDPATNFDSQIYILSATDPCTGFGCVWANATTPNTLCTASARADIANAFFCTQPGVIYYIIVTVQSGSGGDFVLHLDDTGEGCGAPSNDDCASARTLTTMPTKQLAFLDQATDDAVDVSCDTITGNARRGVWYKHTPTVPGNYTFAEPGGIDVVLTFFTTATDCTALTEAFCTPDESGLNPIFHADAGTTYYMLVSMASGTAALPGLALEINTFDFIPDPGACCDPNVGCVTTADAASCFGTFHGAGSSCSPDPCSQVTGACCDGAGGCTLKTADQCPGSIGTPAANFYQGDNTLCGAANCGVCCRGSTCVTTVLTSEACSGSLPVGGGAGASYLGGVACGGANHKVPCCYADYNKVGGKTVADIFSYLSDWFGHSAFAWNGTPGATGPGNPPVSQIFAFLSDWFAGCN